MSNLFKENEENAAVKIKVLGIGGCGVDTIARIAVNACDKEKFIAIDTAIETLKKPEIYNNLLIGENLTKGMGSCANPEIGRRAAEESRGEIEALLDDTDILFMVAGLGGGTGTGASQVVAEIAKQKGILTIAIVTVPFSFEGKVRSKMANEGIEALKNNVDTLIPIKKDNILALVSENLSMKDAFAVVDDIVAKAIEATENLIVVPALINLDLSDFSTLIKGKGIGQILIGEASGENRDEEAAQNALKSVLLDYDLKKAKSIIFSISSGTELNLVEINNVINIITEAAHVDADVIFGVSTEERLDGKMVITLIATGFEE